MSLAAKPARYNLGTNGKSIHAGNRVKRANADTGYVPVDQARALKMQKYALQRTAQNVLYKHGEHMKDQHRTCWCHRGVVSPADSVTIYRQVNGESARMQGVTTCKSVWTCPVCSARICAVRQSELSDGVKAWANQGGYTWLMTLTFPHEFGMALKDLMGYTGEDGKKVEGKFSKARQSFKNSRTYKRILGKEVRKGSVASLEVTVGEHGWHPHTHDLVFATPEAFGEVNEIEDGHGRLTSSAIDELKYAWYCALVKAGLCEQHQMSDVLKHGLDIRGGQYAAEYIAKFGKEQKWGLSREVTMHAAKVGSDNKGAHPFQLLAWAADGDDHAADQFREYAEAFEGKRMLSWSPGLKKELTGIEETTDEEAAEVEMPDEEVAGHIDSEGLSVLVSRNQVGNFLGYVSQFCIDPVTRQADIDAYIDDVRRLGRSGRGTVKVKMWTSVSADPLKGFKYVDQEELATA